MTRACSKCGTSDLNSVAPSIYNYKISGLDNVYLKDGVTKFICPNCGTKSTAIKNVIGLHQTIAQALTTAKRRIAGSELRFLRELADRNEYKLEELKMPLNRLWLAEYFLKQIQVESTFGLSIPTIFH